MSESEQTSTPKNKSATLSIFSQSHPAFFMYKDLGFISAGHFMIYSKAKTFGDEDLANVVLNIEKAFIKEDGTFANEDDKLSYQIITEFKNGETTRDEILSNEVYLQNWNSIQLAISQLSKNINSYDPEVWETKESNVAYVANREKFYQNHLLLNDLMETPNPLLKQIGKHNNGLLGKVFIAIKGNFIEDRGPNRMKM